MYYCRAGHVSTHSSLDICHYCSTVHMLSPALTHFIIAALVICHYFFHSHVFHYCSTGRLSLIIPSQMYSNTAALAVCHHLGQFKYTSVLQHSYISLHAPVQMHFIPAAVVVYCHTHQHRYYWSYPSPAQIYSISAVLIISSPTPPHIFHCCSAGDI